MDYWEMKIKAIRIYYLTPVITSKKARTTSADENMDQKSLI